MSPPEPHQVDCRAGDPRNSLQNIVRRLIAALCWFLAACFVMVSAASVALKKDALSSINSDLEDWRDIAKAVSRDSFLAIFFVVCALWLRRKPKTDTNGQR
jgi:hypothetical protein